MNHNPAALSAKILIGKAVVNSQGDVLGKIEDFMLDLADGCVAYAVFSFSGLLGTNNKLFALPLSVLDLDAEHQHFVLNVSIKRLKKAPGFDQNNWPEDNTQDDTWLMTVYDYYESEGIHDRIY